jgi:hypothetical protein
MAEQLLEEMIQKINQITASLDGTIAQINTMGDAINSMSQKFSEETVALTENIRLIVEVIKQFRTKSAGSMQELSDEFNTKLKVIYDEKVLESITEEETGAIDIIQKASKEIANNVYYAQLLTIIQSIREETNRIMGNTQ